MGGALPPHFWRSTMKYVYVAGGNSMDIDMEHAITKQTGFALFSLIHGLKQNDFGLHTLEDVTCDIRKFVAMFIRPVGGMLVADSGGYSFIKGDIPPPMLPMLIDCYCVYLENEWSQFDYIFSLDIPFSLKYSSFNSAENVYEANKKSLIAIRKILIKNPELRNKLYFVWHFKIKEQFSIWKHLYKELELDRFVRNHAIGGMVGIKKASRIKFTPFTSMSFYILNAYLDSSFAGEQFRLHFLGIYARYDRFHIAFLQALFRKYLAGIAEVEMSYDSINPVHTVRMNATLPLYHLVGDRIEVFPSLLDVPADMLRNLTANEGHARKILLEMERRRNGIRLENSAAFSPINVFSNLELDRFFEMIIEAYDLVGEMDHASSPTNLAGRLNRIFGDIQLKHPGVFTPHMQKCIFLSLEQTWFWHRWFKTSRDQKKLEEYMAQAIREIGFPVKLP